MGELERTWAITSAHAEGVSIRKIAAAAGLGPTRVHAIVRDAELDGLDAALGELRSLYGWPAPEDPDGSREEELAGRELIAARLLGRERLIADAAEDWAGGQHTRRHADAARAAAHARRGLGAPGGLRSTALMAAVNRDRPVERGDRVRVAAPCFACVGRGYRPTRSTE